MECKDISYLLSRLAKIKCSICSFQCENWKCTHWVHLFHLYFWVGRVVILVYWDDTCASVLCIALPHCDAHRPLLIEVFLFQTDEWLWTNTKTPIRKHRRIPRRADAETQEVQRKADSEDDDVLVDLLLSRLLRLTSPTHPYALAHALQQSNRTPRTPHHYVSHKSYA